MKRYTTGVLALLAVAAVVGAAVWHSVPRPGRAAQASRALPKGDLIEVGTPRRRNFSIRYRWFGRAESKEIVRIVALEPGRIVSAEAPDETSVKKGALLFILSGPRIRDRLKAMRARIASLRDRVALARQAVVMKQEAVAQKMARKEELLSRKDTLSRLRSDLARAEREWSSFRGRLQVRAPRDGVFTHRRVSAGQEVEEGAPLAEIIPPDSVRIVATLFPPEGVSLAGLKAIVSLGRGKTVSATVAKVLPRRTREGATVVWIEGGELRKRLAPGETASGEIVVSVHKGALAVPASGVLRDREERAFVFLKTPRGYIKKAVKTGRVSDGWIEIVDGVRETDRVVVRGAYELFYEDFNKIYRVQD